MTTRTSTSPQSYLNNNYRTSSSQQQQQQQQPQSRSMSSSQQQQHSLIPTTSTFTEEENNAKLRDTITTLHEAAEAFDLITTRAQRCTLQIATWKAHEQQVRKFLIGLMLMKLSAIVKLVLRNVRKTMEAQC